MAFPSLPRPRLLRPDLGSQPPPQLPVAVSEALTGAAEVGSSVTASLAGLHPTSLQSLVTERLAETLGGREPLVESTWAEPAGDPGIFGPWTVTWRVHGDIGCMFVGGFAALMLQTLHPGAMAGVADHSDFQEDPLGRLQRTGNFVGVTTFGGTEQAMDLVAQVRTVHSYVTGTRPDGVPYEANDPALLRWVHTAEVASFLRSYRRFSGDRLSRRDCDRYFAECAVAAEALGATEVPSSLDAVARYFRDVRDELVAGDQALETIAFILGARPETEPEGRVYDLLMRCSIGLLPAWARDMLGLEHSRLDDAWSRPTMTAVAAALRLAIGEPEIRTLARRRCTADAAA